MAKRKNKDNTKFSINDLMPVVDENPGSSIEEDLDINVNKFSFDNEYIKAVKNYNSNITDFKEEYTTLKPLGYEMIIRAFVKEPVITEDGITLPNREVIGIPTRSGQGYMEEIIDPYGFKRKAVVVSVGKNVTEYEPGDVVYLRAQLQATPLGAAGEVTVYIPNAFIHPDSGLDKSPTDPNDPHFGYLLMYENDTLGKDTRGLG